MEDVADSAPESREQFMRIALQMAERGMAAGGPPVGACLVRADEVIAAGHNAVVSELDVTAHAELSLIREACQAQRTLSLAGCVLYVTVQPCAMCLGASFYAGISQIVFGAPITEMQSRTQGELCISAAELYAGEAGAPLVSGGLLEQECTALLSQWRPERSTQ